MTDEYTNTDIEVINIGYSVCCSHNISSSNTSSKYDEILNLIINICNCTNYNNYYHYDSPDYHNNYSQKIKIKTNKFEIKFNSDTQLDIHIPNIYILVLDIDILDIDETNPIIYEAFFKICDIIKATGKTYLHVLLFSESNIFFFEKEKDRIMFKDAQKKYDFWKRYMEEYVSKNQIQSLFSCSPISCKTNGHMNDISGILGKSVKHTGHLLLKDSIGAIIQNGYTKMIESNIEKKIKEINSPQCLFIKIDSEIIDTFTKIQSSMETLCRSQIININDLLKPVIDKICKYIFNWYINADQCTDFDLAINQIYDLMEFVEYVENIIEHKNNDEIDKLAVLINMITTKKYETMNKTLEKIFDVDIFLDLYQSRELSIMSYIKCIQKTLENKCITPESLFGLIDEITRNDDQLYKTALFACNWHWNYQIN